MLLSPQKKIGTIWKTSGFQLPHPPKQTPNEVPGGGALGLRRRSAIDGWGFGGCTYRRQQVPRRFDRRETRVPWEGDRPGRFNPVVDGPCWCHWMVGATWKNDQPCCYYICNKLETPTTSHRCLKKKVHLVFQVYLNLCFFHAFVTNEMGLSVLFLYELVFILPGDVMHIEGGYAKK